MTIPNAKMAAKILDETWISFKDFPIRQEREAPNFKAEIYMSGTHGFLIRVISGELQAFNPKVPAK